MAQRRMFSPEIVCSEEFLDMPPSSRELYFQLGMRADDDGFIQPRSVMRVTGATTDDLKLLVTKRFILPFDTGVVVIKHWLIHNMIRMDRYKPTRFVEEKNSLYLKQNKAYTDNPENGLQIGNQLAPQVRLGKDSLLVADAKEVRIEKDNSDSERKTRPSGGKKTTPEMEAVFAVFDDKPARHGWKLRAHEREAAAILAREYGVDELKRRYLAVKKFRDETLCPKIDNPTDFLEKMPKMEHFLKTLQKA